MKFKTTAIAMAVAGSVAAPVAVQAGADELYASARIGLWNVDTDGINDLEVLSFSSRFGAKGETDLGNGMTGFGRYEWDVDFNSGDEISVRHRYVGLKGDFGSVLLGHTYHTFYNTVVGPLDTPWWHSGYAMIDYRGRTDDAITYSGGTGAISFGASLYFTREAGEDAPDQTELGVSFPIGDTTLGIAVVTTEAAPIGNGTDENLLGVAWSGIALGDTSLGVSFQSQDDDTGITVDWVFGSAYLHFETESIDATDQDRTSITLGYTQSLGRKTTAYYEINTVDDDSGDSDTDRTALMAVLKYDII